MSDNTATIEDTPTERTRFDQLSFDQQAVLLDQIRERRLASLFVYQELQAKKEETANEKLAVKANKLLAKIDKRLQAASKAIDEIDAMRKEIMSMNMQLENE